jgi:hypothetical protein
LPREGKGPGGNKIRGLNAIFWKVESFF